MAGHVCPVCGGTLFLDKRVGFANGPLVGLARSGLLVSICQGCSAVFTDLAKATATAARLQKEREDEIERAVESALESHRRCSHRRPGDD